ncbi:hypothetical protein D9M71_287260 [compost metagenome]
MLAAVLAGNRVEVQLQAEVVGQVAAGAQVGIEQLAAGGGEGGAFLQRGLPLARDRRADEVDHAADVVRPVLHGGAATHHIDAVQGRQGHREQRQTGLPIGRQCQRHAVGQGLDSPAAAFIQATHGDLRQGAGAGFVEDLYPGYALQGIVDASYARCLELGRIHHATAAGVGAYLFVAGTAQHIALDDHGGDEGGFGRCWCGRSRL